MGKFRKLLSHIFGKTFVKATFLKLSDKIIWTTVWKVHNFSVTHILRENEINFREFGSSKTAIFAFQEL